MTSFFANSTTGRRLRRGSAAVVVGLMVLLNSAPAYATNPQCDANGFCRGNILAFTNTLAFYALAMCVVGIFISAALWALGNKGQNPGTELTGKKGMILCCTAAFFIGALPAFINYLDDQARDIDTNNITRDVSNSPNPIQLAPDNSPSGFTAPETRNNTAPSRTGEADLRAPGLPAGPAPANPRQADELPPYQPTIRN